MYRILNLTITPAGTEVSISAIVVNRRGSGGQPNLHVKTSIVNMSLIIELKLSSSFRRYFIYFCYLIINFNCVTYLQATGPHIRHTTELIRLCLWRRARERWGEGVVGQQLQSDINYWLGVFARERPAVTQFITI